MNYNLLLLISLLSVQAVTSQFVQYDRITIDDSDDYQFGFAVAMSGTTLAITAPGYNNNEGAVYIYEQDPNLLTFNQTQILTASDGDEDFWFGMSIAMTDSLMLVGAPLFDGSEVDSRPNQGAVYVFELQGDDTWDQIDQLVGSPINENDRYGRSVDISSDGSRFIVGAFRDSEDTTDKGSAYVYDASDRSLISKIIADDGETGDEFGRSVAIEDDAVMVGAYLDTVGTAASQGSVYLFNYNSGTSDFEQVEQVTAPDGVQDDRLGRSIDIEGTRVVTSSYLKHKPDNDEGVVYLYTRTITGLILQAEIVPDDVAELDTFGSEVRLLGDKLVASSPFADVDGVIDAGAVYVFSDFLGTNEYTEYQKLYAFNNDPVEYEALGTSIAIVSNTDGEYVVTGAISVDPDQTAITGVVYVFGPDVYTAQPSSPPSEKPSSYPTGSFEYCSPVYDCDPHINLWPWNREDKTLIHRYKGYQNTTCEVRCIFESRLTKFEEEGWGCGTCIY